MFDIGFWELAMIGVIALLVVGPERLPGMVRTTSGWVRKLRGFVSTVKSDLENEFPADELDDLQEKPDALNDVYEMIDETREAFSEASRELADTPDEMDTSNTGAETSTPPDKKDGGTPA